MTTYRAALLTPKSERSGQPIRLTDETQAELDHDEMLRAARSELEVVGCPPWFDSIDEAMAYVVVDEWTE